MNRAEQTQLISNFPQDPTRDNVEQWFENEVIAAASRICNQKIKASLRFDLRGKKAGVAHLKQHLIRINGELFHYPEDHYKAVWDTILHEMAHLMVEQSVGKAQPHGQEWQFYIEKLGGTANVTHQLPLKKVRRSRKFIYLLESGRIVELSPIRHRRLQGKEGIYRVRSTGESIKPEDFTGKEIIS